MPRPAWTLALLAAAPLAVGTPLAAAAQVQVQVTPTPDAPVVTVTVQDTAEVAPDIATVRVGVETLAPTAVAALQQNSVKMARVVAAIRAAGVPDRDIRTNAVSVGARTDYRANQRVFLGYNAGNTVAVILRDVAKVGAFLDRVTAAGANEVDGPTFTVDRPEVPRALARDRAVERATAEAQAYARRAGFSRARLLSLTEQQGFVQPVDIVVTGSRLAPMAVSAPPPPVLGGQQSVGVAVTGIYRLDR